MHIGSHPKQGPLQSRRMKWLWDKIQGKHLQLLQGCFPRPSSLLNTRPSFCLSLAILTLSSHLCSQCSKSLLENIVFSLWGKICNGAPGSPCSPGPTSGVIWDEMSSLSSVQGQVKCVPGIIGRSKRLERRQQAPQKEPAESAPPNIDAPETQSQILRENWGSRGDTCTLKTPQRSLDLRQMDPKEHSTCSEF